MEGVTIYDQAGQMLGYADRASNISYVLKHNDLWTGSFALPSPDPLNAQCAAHNRVRLPDGKRDLGLYRIVGMPSSEETGLGGWKTYSVEHVMATLLDDVLFGYHEIGGTGVPTADVIDYILGYQTTQLWTRGVCDFTDAYQYNFENCSLLAALLSLGNVLTQEYTWDFDTSTTPWTVNLRRADSAAGCGIYYARNLAGIEKTMDASALITRLYPLGYGEGVNQLTIREVNNDVPYIDADTVATWGVKASVYTDTTQQDPATLMARAQAALEEYKNPYISYKASAIDLYQVTGLEWDRYMPGKLVSVMDGEHGISFAARIVEISKSDTQGAQGDISITIANRSRDTTDSLNALAQRVGISELYSQGATNIYNTSFADNADATHPAKMRVYIPSGLVRINQMLLSWNLAAFRTYSTGAAGGGGSTVTSSQQAATSTTSGSGGGVSTTSGAGGGYATISTVSYADNNLGETGTPVNIRAGTSDTYDDASNTGNEVADGSNHYHQHSHIHLIKILYMPPMAAHINDHTHAIELSDHTHRVTIPAHDHTVEIQSHTHELVYGIYEGTTATTVSVKVDGSTIPSSLLSSGMDIVSYLSTDQQGKVQRGVWHEIQIIPNRLTRVEAQLFAQCFIQSRGGGDY